MTLIRKTPLRRSTRLAPGGKPRPKLTAEEAEAQWIASRPKRRKRSKSEFARIYGSPARVRFVASLPCVGCGRGPCENAHIETGGMGRKADSDRIVPLCNGCHREFHWWGREDFEDGYHIDLEGAALQTEMLWRRATQPGRTDE